MPQSLANIYVHLIFSTKDRAHLITDQVRQDLHSYMASVLSENKSPAVLVNSVEDHVHILLNLSRTLALAKAVEEVKRSSSKWIKTQGSTFSDFTWQAGYGAFSVSESNAAQVANYIKNQKEHHRKVTFQEEYREFLEKNNMPYDERYLWD